MGFFSEQEIASLEINNMILHVVGGQQAFQPESVQTLDHQDFFIARIREVDVDAVYSFVPTSQTKRQIERIASGADDFQMGSRTLSSEFSRVHLGSTREGAFFIFELTSDDPGVKIYSLIKYDYKEAIERTGGANGSILRRIVDAFIADKKAIQKSAIIRVSNGVAEAAISAHDRMKSAPEIGDYFAAFLDVTRTRSNQQLSQQAVDILRRALEQSRDDLPDRDVARAFRRAKDSLRSRQSVSEDAITEAILAAADNPDDENVRARLCNAISRKVRSAKLEGLAFPPDPQVFRKPPMRKLKTTEGVILFYPDEAAGVQRLSRPDGGETITIQTARITEDSVVADNARGAA